MFYLDEVYLALLSEREEVLKDMTKARVVRYLNISKFAREIAQFKNSLTVILLDV